MNALILTISAGGGHNTAARAVELCLKEKGIHTEIVDAYKFFSTALSNTVEKGCLISTKYVPRLYGRIYRIAEKRNVLDTDIKMGALGSGIVSEKLADYIVAKRPDVIISTHLFPAELLTTYREERIIRCLTVGIVTDFTVHPFWEETNLDYYVTATYLLNHQMQKKGIPEEKILPFGIPVHPKFSVRASKQEARKALGISDMPTVFVITGSMGYGSVAKHVKRLAKSGMEFQLLCVCGNNRKLKRHLERLNLGNHIHIYGFVNNVDTMMDAADCIVTKPGGLTVSEALTKGLPLILIDPIPGQEDRNVEFLLNCGVAVRVTKTFPIDEAIYQVFENKARKEFFPKAVSEIAKPLAGQQLGAFIFDELTNRGAAKRNI